MCERNKSLGRGRWGSKKDKAGNKLLSQAESSLIWGFLCYVQGQQSSMETVLSKDGKTVRMNPKDMGLIDAKSCL